MTESFDDDQFAAHGDSYDTSEQWPLRQHCEAPSLLTAAGDLTGLSVLDAGCGSGFYLRRFARMGASRLIGLDPSEGMLEVARARAAAAGLDITFARTGLSQAGRFGPVDLVTAVYVLPYAESLHDLGDMCLGAARALRPGGRFVAAAFNPGCATDPEWYRPYGFTIETTNEDRDGVPAVLTSHLFDPPLRVTGYRWSAESHETALGEAGFDEIKWVAPRPTAAGIAEHGLGFWEPYTTCPHSLIITARRS